MSKAAGRRVLNAMIEWIDAREGQATSIGRHRNGLAREMVDEIQGDLDSVTRLWVQ